MEIQLNGEKSIKTGSIFQLIMYQHGTFFGSFVSVLEGFEEAKNHFTLYGFFKAQHSLSLSLSTMSFVLSH
jgi:hypothetical protein